MKNFNKAEYKYNSSGLRTSKTVNGEKTDFILDGIYVIAEIKDGDVTNYIRGVTGIIYSKDKRGTKTYYVTNNHGDVTVLVNSSGNIIKEYKYDEYGVETNPDKEDTNPFRYCGEYYDTETGFIYLRARYYDPELGRFISEDPARDEVNWYSYANNNPVTFIDPLGLSIILTGTDEENQKSLEQLQMLTNDELSLDVETGVVSILNTNTENTDKNLVLGTQMIADMVNNNDFELSIQRIYQENTGCWVNYTENGAVVTMNDWDEEGGNWYYEVSDENGNLMFEDHKDVAHIILGHEIIHATHHMNGTTADRTRTVYRYVDTELVEDRRGLLNVSEEYNTTGLYYIVETPNPNGALAIRKFYVPRPGTLTENALRAEQGLKRRTAY